MNDSTDSRLTIGTDRTHWEAIGDPYPADRLHARIYVNGCAVHLEAIRVQNDSHGLQRACQRDLEASIDGALMISSDGPFQTAAITVDGTAGDYVIVAVSHAT